MNKQVEKHLKEFFYIIADRVDGGEKLPKDLRAAYMKAWKDPAFREFYGQEVEANNESWLD